MPFTFIFLSNNLCVPRSPSAQQWRSSTAATSSWRGSSCWWSSWASPERSASSWWRGCRTSLQIYRTTRKEGAFRFSIDRRSPGRTLFGEEKQSRVFYFTLKTSLHLRCTEGQMHVERTETKLPLKPLNSITRSSISLECTLHTLCPN